MSEQNCEIVCLGRLSSAGWRWRVREARGGDRTSKENFELFYECVTDARREGYEPRFEGKRIVCGASKPPSR
jgi:hypothetical protein